MQIMNYSSTFEAHMRILVRIQETFEERVFRLTGSPRGNVCLGTRQMKATPLLIMKEESAGEGIHYKGSPGTWDFRYELVMLRITPIRYLAISPGQVRLRLRGLWHRGRKSIATRIFSCAIREWKER
jgi:hypothetical protein